MSLRMELEAGGRMFSAPSKKKLIKELVDHTNKLYDEMEAVQRALVNAEQILAGKAPAIAPDSGVTEVALAKLWALLKVENQTQAVLRVQYLLELEATCPK